MAPGNLSFGSAPSVSRLGLEDVRRVGDAIGDPRRVAATVASGEIARVGSRRATVNVQGTTETIPLVFDRTVARGAFSGADVETRRRVAVLGADPAESLFPDRDPVGKSITVGGVRFRVIGVMSRVGTAFGVARDAELFVPVTAAQRLFGISRVDGIAVKASGTEQIDEEQAIIREVVTRAHPEQEYQVLTQQDILGVVGRILGILTLVLASIAGISLVVGGVGVMNIMLVSVSERTREIGLRKAVGARTRDVLRQFLLEAVALTVSGGVVGILLGIGGACWSGASRRCRRPSPAGRSPWPSGSAWPSACSSASGRPAWRPACSRLWPCATSEPPGRSASGEVKDRARRKRPCPLTRQRCTGGPWRSSTPGSGPSATTSGSCRPRAADWNVRQLVNHLVYENLDGPADGGSTIAEVGDRYEGDLLGDALGRPGTSRPPRPSGRCRPTGRWSGSSTCPAGPPRPASTCPSCSPTT